MLAIVPLYQHGWGKKRTPGKYYACHNPVVDKITLHLTKYGEVNLMSVGSAGIYKRKLCN